MRKYGTQDQVDDKTVKERELRMSGEMKPGGTNLERSKVREWETEYNTFTANY